ncbi:PASTA domain-containing protein [bacterium]|nr:PASTA domain-containing protein [bacterium]
MTHLKAFGISLIIFILFVWIVLVVTTKIVIPMKLDIGDSLKAPDVVELTLSEAKKKLIEAGFNFQDSLAIEWVKSPIYPDSTVISQNPIANKIVKNRNRIKLEVSSGGIEVVIPTVLEENAINASSRIKQMGLEVELVKKNYGLYPENTVAVVEPTVGTKVLKGSKVTLYIESEIEDIMIDKQEESLEESQSKSEIDEISLEDILKEI